ncbi:hypothetical protein NC651_037351 [Populus alba x Populus x berolinensis]|nr:hypothetical protein NC651_037351 [Populus alba x Populus x berolinensis]
MHSLSYHRLLSPIHMQCSRIGRARLCQHEFAITCVNLADASGSNNPYKPVFSCGRGKRYCVPKTPPPCRATYKRNC